MQTVQPVDEIFEYLTEHPSCEMDFSFSSLEPLTDAKVLRTFVESHHLQEYVMYYHEKMSCLAHPNYDFHVIIESDEQGDEFTHGVILYVNQSGECLSENIE